MKENARCPATGTNVGTLYGILGVVLLTVIVVEKPMEKNKKDVA